MDCRFQIADFRLQISDFRLQISDFRLQISDFRYFRFSSFSAHVQPPASPRSPARGGRRAPDTSGKRACGCLARSAPSPSTVMPRVRQRPTPGQSRHRLLSARRRDRSRLCPRAVRPVVDVQVELASRRSHRRVGCHLPAIGTMCVSPWPTLSSFQVVGATADVVKRFNVAAFWRELIACANGLPVRQTPMSLRIPNNGIRTHSGRLFSS